MEVDEVNYNKQRKPRRTSRFRKNVMSVTNDYAAGTTIHGLSYTTNPKVSIVGRLFWVGVVILAILCTTFQMLELRKQWNKKPVITNLETISLPLEDIDFPSVTICPQGGVKEVMDNVMFLQLKDYIMNKTERGQRNLKLNDHRDERSISQSHEKSPWNITYDQMTTLIIDFLQDRYPGTQDIPKNVVTMLTSDDPQRSAENDAILQLNEEKECNETSNVEILDNLNNGLNWRLCPDGFTRVNEMCVRKFESSMVYQEASKHCENTMGAKILQLYSYDEIKALNQYGIIGIKL